MSIAQSFSNFLEVTRDDDELFALGAASYHQAALGLAELGPITITAFSDFSATLSYKKEYWVADSPEEIINILLHLATKYPHLRPIIASFDAKLTEALS